MAICRESSKNPERLRRLLQEILQEFSHWLRKKNSKGFQRLLQKFIKEIKKPSLLDGSVSFFMEDWVNPPGVPFEKIPRISFESSWEYLPKIASEFLLEFHSEFSLEDLSEISRFFFLKTFQGVFHQKIFQRFLQKSLRKFY